MDVTLQIDTDCSFQEASEVIRSAIEHEKHLAKYKIDRYAMICDKFEDQCDLLSTEFIQRFEAGDLVGEDTYFEWYAAKRGLDHWKKKLSLLKNIKL